MTETTGAGTTGTDDRARLLAALRHSRAPEQRRGIPRADRSGVLPVSFGQRRLWLLDRLAPDSPAYMIYLCARLRGELDVPALRASLDALLRRHEALRTVFSTVDGQPVQRVLPAVPESGSWDVLELAGPPAGTDLRAFLTEWVRRPFDLAAGPPLRGLLTRADDGWVFGLNVHHIAIDGWSFATLLRELAHCYRALRTGGRPQLPPVEVDYPDYAVWQRNWLTGPVLEEKLAHWERHLRDAPEVLELPFDRPRPAVQSFQGAAVGFEVDAPLAAGLKQLASAGRATLFMVLLAAFKVLLARHSGQPDLVVGVPVAGRDRVEFEPVVGFFANTLALRTDTGGDPTFTELLARVRQTTLASFAHQDVPFEVLVERLAPQQRASHNPLFQVMFAFQNTPDERFRLDGLEAELMGLDTGSSKFDLWLSVQETPEGRLWAILQYDSALFDEATAQRLVERYQRLLAAVADDPETRIGRLPVMPDGERDRVLALGTGPEAGVPAGCVHELIGAQAAGTPDAVAVSFGGTHLTYGQLDRRANRLAHRLRELGVRAETPVAVVLPRSAELVVALLAILKAGGAYLPIDPDYPAGRIRYLLEHSDPPVLITRTDLVATLPDRDPDRVVLLDPGTDFDTPDTAPDVPVPPDGLAYIIYTSGSTGVPKGAMITHRALANRLRWMRHTYRIVPRDNILQKTPYSFDVSVWEFFLPLISGATLVVAPPGAHRDPAELADLMARAGVTVTHFVPAMLAVFLDQPWLPDLPGLRLLVCSGEALPRDLAALAADRLGVPCHNLYGPTEAAIDVTAYPAGSSPAEGGCAVTPIGRPIDNVRVHVLDPELNPQPVGVPGELFIGGVAVGRGYLRQPGRTAERFLPDPFGPAGSVLYRTGDLVRLLPDGNLDFLGRLDHQVKIHGHRIELGEIEATLRDHPGVRDAVTVVTDDRSLVGYVVPAAASGDAVPERSAAVVDRWTHVFDDVYRPDAPEDSGTPDGPDYAGWRSSYTGEDYSADDMAEWVAGTVGEIRELRPGCILEVGCGSGLLLAGLLPSVTRYVATDVSGVAIDRLGTRYRDDDRVELRVEPADRIDAAGEFDVVLLNSVVQYFSGADYLEQVLTRAVRACRPGGSVFVGDVRSLPLLPAFHLSVLAAGSTGPVAAAELRDQLGARTGQETELVIDPEFFVRFAREHGLAADIRLKPGERPTEMNLFRYDVRLRPATDALLAPASTHRLRWDAADPARLLDTVAAGNAPATIVDIPHPGQAALVRAVTALGKAAPDDRFDPGELVRESAGGTPPAELRGLAAARGLTCYCVPSPGRPGHYDAVLAPRPVPGLAVDAPAGDTDRVLANDPGAHQRDRELATELREHLRERLPEFAVPAAVVVLPELPLTPNGKIDRGALPALVRAPRQDYQPPQGLLERQLATIVADLLGVPRLGRDDNFFGLGGDSIVALQVVNKAQRAGITLSARTVFQHPTIAAMAAACGTAAVDGSTAPAPEATPPAGPAFTGRPGQPWERLDPRPWRPVGAPSDAYPLSPMQHEMLSAALERPEPGLNVVSGELRITGKRFDENAFVSAWQYLMQRHAPFRTSFTWRGLPRPVQATWPITGPPITRVDLTGLPAAEQQRCVQDKLWQEKRHVFDLEHAPHWYVTLYRLGADDYRAVLRLSYMFQDGWSWENIQRELFAGYDEFRQGRVPRLPAVPEFAEYIHWLTGRDQAGDAEYWSTAMKRFAGRTPLVESLGAARLVGRDELPYAHEVRHFGPDTQAALRRATRQRGVTTFTVLQGAWALLLSAATGQRDVTFGSITSGRPGHLPRMAEMIGPFNNMLPVPVDVDDRATAGDWLHSLQVEQSEMREHQYSSLAQIRDWAGLPWREPLYDSYLVYENFPMDPGNARRLRDWELTQPSTQTEHPLRVLIWPSPFYVVISYYLRHFDAATVRRLLAGYEWLAAALAGDPGAALADLKRAAADLLRPAG